MVKILANDGIMAGGKQLLLEKGFELDDSKREGDELLKDLQHFDALLVRSATKVTKEIIDAGTNLKFIGRGGVGMDNIDIPYAESKGIKVVNTPAASSQSVAELVLAHMFAGARFLHSSNREMPKIGDQQFKALKKTYSKGTELNGKKLGIIGFGRIGQAVARMAIGVGMYILPYDRLYKEKLNFEIQQIHVDDRPVILQIQPQPIEEVLTESDILTIHIPFKPGSTPFIGAKEFEMMKQNVMIINTARGGVIDEVALLKYLNNDKVAFAGLDVYENEPAPNKALLEHPKVSLTPHIGASTNEGQERVWLEMANLLSDYFNQ